MAVQEITVGGNAITKWNTAYAAAADGDTIRFMRDPIADTTVYDLGPTFRGISKRLIIEGEGWEANQAIDPLGPDGNWHDLDDVPIRVRGWFQFNDTGARNSIMRGFALDGATRNLSTPFAVNQQAAGQLIVNAEGVEFWDMRMSNREPAHLAGQSGTIWCQIGTTRATGATTPVAFRRCRFRHVGGLDTYGKNHDHCIYAKTSRFLILEDCLAYECVGWFWHAYTDCDDGVMRYCTIDRVFGGVTYSGDSSNTVLGGYQASVRNRTEFCHITRSQGGLEHGMTAPDLMYSVDYYNTPGPNYLADSNVWQGTATAGRIRTSGTGTGVTQQGSILNSDPQYQDPANGDYRLTASTPVAMNAWGPRALQYDPIAPPPPPDSPPGPVTGLTATAGVVSGRVTLTWTNPGGSPDAIVVRRGTTSFPASSTAGTGVYSGTGTSVNDNGLTDGTTYRYSVFVQEGVLFSTAAQVTAVPEAPIVVDEDIVGKTTPGTAGFKGMTPDVKRGWLVTFPPDKQIKEFRAHLVGNGAITAIQSLRAFAYDATAGVSASMPLLGVSSQLAAALNINNAEQWIPVAAPIVLPAAGGQMVIGIHSGGFSGTRTPADAEVRYSYDIQAGALHVASDTFADGTASTFGALTLDTALGTFWAVLEDVDTPAEEPPNPVTGLTATVGDGNLRLSWTNPTTPFDGIVVRRATGTYPTDETDGALAYEGLASSFTDSPLPNGTQQFYRVYARRDGLFSTAAQVAATPIADAPDPPDEEEPPPPPPPSQGLLAAIDQSIVYLEDYLTTATAALTSSGVTVTRDDDDLAVSNYTLATDCLNEVRRARALLFRMVG